MQLPVILIIDHDNLFTLPECTSIHPSISLSFCSYYKFVFNRHAWAAHVSPWSWESGWKLVQALHNLHWPYRIGSCMADTVQICIKWNDFSILSCPLFHVSCACCALQASVSQHALCSQVLTPSYEINGDGTGRLPGRVGVVFTLQEVTTVARSWLWLIPFGDAVICDTSATNSSAGTCIILWVL